MAPTKEEVDKFHNVLKQRKSVIARYLSQVTRFVTEEEHGQANEYIRKLKATFDEFDGIFTEFVQILDEDDPTYNEAWFDEVQKRYLEVYLNAKQFLSGNSECKPKSAKSVPPTEKPVEASIESALNLPHVIIEPFDGDPLKYHAFVRTFAVIVERVCDDPDACLARLISCTEGAARDAIQGTLVMGGKEGYSKAKEILAELFGANQLVVQEIVRGIHEEKQVNSAEQVRKFSYRLINARDILTKLNALDEVDSQFVIRSIVERLPSFAQDRWNKKQLASKREKKNYLKFSDLVDFVQVIAADMSDPVCVSSKARHNAERSSKKERVFVSNDSKNQEPGVKFQGAKAKTATQGKQRSKQPCILCGDAHSLSRCVRFKEMNVNDRRTFVNDNKLCLNCLHSDHFVAECISDNRCFVCKQKHSVFLHTDGPTVHAIHNDAAFMPVVKVRVNDNRWVRAALDSCSSGTFCSKELADSLQLEGRSISYSLKTLSGEAFMSNSKTVSLSLSKGQESTLIHGVRVVDRIPISCGDIDPTKYSHLQDIDITANLRCDHVDILIGQDCPDALVPLAVRKGNGEEPFAVLYKFGWTLNGMGLRKSQCSNAVICHFIGRAVDEAYECDYGRAEVERYEPSVIDKRVIQFWDENCYKSDGHYVLPIPWKNRDEPIPNNFWMAKKRLDSLLARLNNENLFERYDQEIRTMLAEGYAEIVDGSKLGAERVWYLPHHHVINPKKPNKLRVVFDCAAKFEGQSLNQRVHQGPDLVNSLISVLLKFRLHAYAIQADIKGMYNQVSVPLQDRDALRFLWCEDGRLVHYRMKVHLFGGVWCSSVATYALRKVIQDNPNVDSLLGNAVLQCMYVDDCLVSVGTKAEAIAIIDGLPELLRTGGFVLTKFVVNDEELISGVPMAHTAKEVHEFSPKSVGRALGVQWNIYKDTFFYDVAPFESNVVTRRTMLKYIGSVFDPLGLSSPWVLPGRLLLQEVTKLGLAWDDEIPMNLRSRWHIWLGTLGGLQAISFPRCLIEAEFANGYLEYHVFCDASQSAYGACVYLRCASSKGQVVCKLIAAKGHVAPVNQQTVPRLELQAAVVAVKLAAEVMKQMNLDSAPVYYWSDSTIVLAYIANKNRRFKTFVANRVGTIRSYSNTKEWNHVSSGDNPADLLTKGQSIDTVLWQHGPAWLNMSNPFWMTRNERAISEYPVEDNDPEVARAIISHHISVLSEHCIDRMAAYYSSWNGLKRAVAWLQRYILYLQGKRDFSRNLSSSDIAKAEGVVIRRAQQVGYACEVKGEIRKSSRIYPLSPFLDDSGILRVGGRIQHHPIILPHFHNVAVLILQHYHNVSHSGTEWTLSRVREKFWITNARSKLKSIRASCFICKRLFGKAATQKMADLPSERITPNQPPFTYVGIDVFGPIQVSVGRSSTKRYGCLFSCLTTRAVHIEVINSLDCDGFLSAFRRFVARRGQPLKVFSDNGTNFCAGEGELRKAFQRHSRETLAAYGADRGMEWCFIPPGAPHMGGVWERMVGVVKRVLKGVMQKAVRLTDEILATFLCEVESLVNSRPLTKLSDDPDDLSPLTPNHLLLLRESCSLPPGIPSQNPYRYRWRYIQHLATEFWTRFIHEYLPMLNHRSKWVEMKREFRSGDLVLVKQPGLPRGLWPLALVEEVERSHDGIVRSASVRTKASKFRRPITNLYPLEVIDD